MTGCHVPARVWTLAKLAAAHGWSVRVDPDRHSAEVAFARGGQLVMLGWSIFDGRAQLEDATVESMSDGPRCDILLRDVPSILTGGAP